MMNELDDMRGSGIYSYEESRLVTTTCYNCEYSWEQMVTLLIDDWGYATYMYTCPNCGREDEAELEIEGDPDD